jgi:hypothetical protein
MLVEVFGPAGCAQALTTITCTKRTVQDHLIFGIGYSNKYNHKIGNMCSMFKKTSK